MNKLVLYQDIQRLAAKGYSQRTIAEKLAISRNTVSKYLKKDEGQLLDWLAETRTRSKKIDSYESQILIWLTESPDLSGAQIYDWLEEKYGELPFGEQTLRRNVKLIREKFNIRKKKKNRQYQTLPDLPMGYQAQLDFGQTKQKTYGNGEVTLYVVAMVLSHSRYKWAKWQTRPFTTTDLVMAHKEAFEYFGGKPQEIVYDQDNIIVTSENSGDLLLTQQFKSYINTERLKLYICRGADPETKGKIERVIQFIKNNFAKDRVYTDIDKWNKQSFDWLVRRGNGKIHNTTKKIPAKIFIEERKMLTPISEIITTAERYKDKDLRTVQKGNIIDFQGNRYSVPLGTYKNEGKKVLVKVQNSEVTIVDIETGMIITKHQLSVAKGMLVSKPSHRKSNNTSTDELMKKVINNFENKKLAKVFIEKIKFEKARYIRDQLTVIDACVIQYSKTILNTALIRAYDNSLFSAIEFRDLCAIIFNEESSDIAVETDVVNTPLSDETKIKLASITAEKRNLNEYITILEG